MKWLVVGAGSAGRRHLETLVQLGETDLAVCDPHEGMLGEVLAKVPAVKERISRSLEDALALGQPDVILVASPTYLHTQHMLTALSVCDKVIVEKPVSHTRADRAAVLKAAEGKTVLVAGQFRHHPSMEQARVLVQEGRMGTLVCARATWGQWLLDWRGPHYAQSYSAWREKGGGLLLDRIHEIDYLRWLFGEPAAVMCHTAKRMDWVGNVEDVAEAVIEFPTLTASLGLNAISRGFECGLVVVGIAGTLEWRFVDREAERGWQELVAQMAEGAASGDFNETAIHATNTLCHLRQAQHWLTVFRGEAEPVRTLEDGYKSLDVALACYESAASGTRVVL